MADNVTEILLRARMEVSGVEAGVGQIQKSLKGLTLPKDISDDLEKSFSKLNPLLKEYQKQLNKGFSSKKDLQNFNLLKEKIDDVLGGIKTKISEVNGQEIRLKTDVQSITKMEKELDNLQKKLTDKMGNIFKSGQTEGGIKDGIKQLQDALNLTSKTGNLKFPALSKLGPEIAKAFNSKEFGSFNNQIQTLQNNIAKLSTTSRFNIAKSLGFDGAKEDIKSIDKYINDFLNKLQVNKISATAIDNLRQQIAQLGPEIEKAKLDALTNGLNEIERASGGINNLQSALNGIQESGSGAASSILDMKSQVQQLQQSTQYFFSLRNMINLLKRGIHEAVDTVKELDAAMTQTAVVTDFSVGDMWEKLPEYTANANALGASVKDMYEATTLYYQQGLDTDAAMGIANETMKMARIGGLEAADATDKMTAALRGFNMELNETSAQRVNDVYSNLAAKTASDTEELGTAMQRTASIAASAGMSFEGTAAFLAQAIETTREPAENLGTAMKTIVARFTELKKNPLEIAEVDGEEVDYNKVDTALKSIGVSLKDANGQFRNLDQVFLDISQRWDSLTQTQQRYVATTAAGSRQQSRFIAMMSNYERTVQLMDYANNSAGASSEQFGKTMESLEAKLNKLKNAWDQFLMGITNSSFIKKGVDGLTNIIGFVNDLIDNLSLGSDGLKSFLSLFATFKGLQLGGKLINSLIGGVGGFLDPSSSFGKGFLGAGKVDQNGNSAGLAGKISTPIVAKLSELIAVTKANKNMPTESVKTSTMGDYKSAISTLRYNRSATIGTMSSTLSSLSDEHAYAAYRSTPGTVDAMKQASLGWLNSKKMPADAQKTGQQLMNSIFKGMEKKEISIKDGMKLLGEPQKWGYYFGTDVAQNFSKSFVKEATQFANNQAIQKLGLDPSKYTVGSNELKELLKDPTYKRQYVSGFQQARGEFGLENAPVIQSKAQAIANSIGGIGNKATTAGMSLQMFGAQLSQLSPALSGVGSLLVRVGTAFSTFGMGVSGMGSLVTGVGKRIAAGQAAVKYGSATMAQAVASGAVAAESTVAATGTGAASAFVSGFTGGMSAGPIAAIISAVVIGGFALIQKHLEKKAQEAGEEVRKNFEEGYTKTNEKIDSLEGYKDRFNELSKGVDQFGHNISLSDEEYNEYLSISRELKELSPSLIAGYNAEGEAILKKGEALDEVIGKLKEERNEALKTYTSNKSVDKLLGEYRTSDAYKDNRVKTGGGKRYKNVQAFADEKSKISKLDDSDLDFNLTDAINQLSGWNLTSLDNLTTEQLNWISQHYSDVIGLIEEENGQLDEKVKEGYEEAFAGAGVAIDEVMTEGQPIIEAMQMWMGDQKLDAVGLGLGEEFSDSFAQGFNSIMLEGLTKGWSSETFKTHLQDYSQGWKQLGGATSEYNKILEQATEYQDNYLDKIGTDGAIEDYQSNVEGLATQLETLAEKYKNTGQAGQAFAEQCIQQANALRNYATESIPSVGEALNTLSEEFESARGAEERFKAATEGGDYYTAAEGYKGIIDTMLDEKNLGGNGSLAFWAGADELLGQEFVDNNSYKDIVNQVQKIQDCFVDGSDGIIAFNDLLTEVWNNTGGAEGELAKFGTLDPTEGFKFDFQNEDLAEFADLLGMSEDALASLIDKARQWVPMDLGNPAQIRQALEGADYSMAGTSSRGDNLLYTSESKFREEARAQGIRGDDYTKTKKDVQKEGVRFLTVENLTAKHGDDLYANKVLDNIGLKGADKTLDNAVAALSKMGFSLEDQQKILTTEGIKLADGTATNETIEQAYNENAYALENPTVAGIADHTGTIAQAATAILASMGILTDQAKADIDASTSEEHTKELTDNLNQDFTDSASRNEAVKAIDDQIADYDETLQLLAQGGITEGEYVDKLTEAKEQLIEAKKSEQEAWDNQISEAYKSIKGTGTEAEQEYLQTNAVDIQNAFSGEDIFASAEALKQLEKEGQLSHDTIAQLALDFLQMQSANLQNLNVEQFKELTTTLGLTAQEANELLSIMGMPFVLQGEITGDDLVAYIQQYEGLNDTEKNILLNAELSGEDKVDQFLTEINDEFGDGTNKTKTILLQAEAKMANGDKAGAESLLAAAGFKENDVQAITQKMSITVDGTIANPDEVQSALDNQLAGMNLKANVKAVVSPSLQIQPNQKINYNTEVNTKNIDAARKAAEKKATMPVDADTSAADKKISSLKNIGSATITVNAKKGTGWTFTASVIEKARGQNYSIPAHRSLSFGSAADGLNIPKKKRSSSPKMTALVGEEGFEVGYIPSERRSVIFGANGPEMTSFPKDTIIYPHKQSKEIIRRGKSGVPTFGSFEYGTDSVKSGGLLSNINSGYTGSSVGKKLTDTAKKTGDKVSKTAEDTAKEVARVLVWWDNAARRAEAIQRKADKNQSSYEKYLKEIQATLKTTGTTGKGNAFITNTQKAIAEYERQFNRANKELKKINKGSAKKTNKGRKKQYNKGADNIVEVSYKKGKKQKTAYMNTAKYVKYDSASGAYQIDQKALRKIKNKDQRKAFYEAAKKELDDRISKKNSAEDNIKKAQEALEKFSEELYNTFFSWENELTKIWNITQKIEQLQSRISGRDAFGNLLDKQLSTGMVKSSNSTKALNLDNFKKRLQLQNQALQDRQEAIKLSRQEVERISKSTNEKQALKEVKAKLNEDAERDKKLQKLNNAKAAKTAYDNAIKNKNKTNKQLNKVDKKIQKLQNKSKLSNSEKEQLENLKKQRTSLQKQIKGYNTTIKNNKTLAGKVNEYQKSYNAVKKTNTNLNATQRAGYEQYKKELEDQIAAQDLARKFTKITRRGDGTIDIEFDTEAFEQERLNGNITSDTAEAVQDWVKELKEASENLQENYENLTKEVTEYYEQLEELQQEWADYGKELTEISEAAEKEKIDKLKKLYDSIKKAIDDLLNEVKRRLDERRKQEDNAKTERDISQKQQRLTMLRADTSGGHQVEIAQLEKEIADAQNDYQRSLEDQLLDRLQQQADEATKQRERQIELQEALAETTNNIAQVNEWMARASSNLTDEELAELKEEIRSGYYTKYNYDTVTDAERLDIESDFEQFFNGLITNQQRQKETTEAIQKLEPIIKQIKDYLALQSLTLETAKKEKYTARQAQEQFGASLSELRTTGKYTFDDFLKSNYSYKQIKSAGFTASNFKSNKVSYNDAKNAGFTLDELIKGGYTEAAAEKADIQKQENLKSEAKVQRINEEAQRKRSEIVGYQQAYKNSKDKKNMSWISSSNNLTQADAYYSFLLKRGNKYDTGDKNWGKIGKDGYKAQVKRGASLGFSEYNVASDLAATDKLTWEEVLKAAKDAGRSGKTIKAWNPKASANSAFRKAFNKVFTKGWSKYATGGIADYTGPAWLDGTPSKPELVLNAKDTKNFLALKDVLSKAISSTGAVENTYGGDAMYEININVDKIEKDYDVDRVIEKVKKEITKGAGYRNVTQVRNFR